MIQPSMVRTISITLLIIGLFAIVLGTIVTELMANVLDPIPAHQQLKVPRDKVIGQLERESEVKYAYKLERKISDSPSENITAAAHGYGLEATDEILNKRTSHSRTFRTTSPNRYITEIYAGEPQQYRDEKGIWWEVGFATTTKDAFDRQMEGISLKENFLATPVFAATDTFYPDPNPESNTHDARLISGSNPQTWATYKAAGSSDYAAQDSVSEDTLLDFRSWNQTDKFDSFSRAQYLFDTSSIPDTDVISSATFSIYGSSIVAASNGLSLDVNQRLVVLVQSNPGSNTIADASDWGSFPNATTTMTKLGTFDPGSTFASWNTSWYNDITLNNSGLGAISKTNITKFGIVFGADADNSAPTWSSGARSVLSAYWADETGTSKDPKLTIVHDASSYVGYKSIDEAYFSSSLHSDPELRRFVATSTKYVVEGMIFASSTNATPDLKIAFDIPSGASMDIGYQSTLGGSLQSGLLQRDGIASSSITLNGNDVTIIHVRGTLIVGANSGNLQLQWAQTSQNSSHPAKILKGSYIKVASDTFQ